MSTSFAGVGSSALWPRVAEGIRLALYQAPGAVSFGKVDNKALGVNNRYTFLATQHGSVDTHAECYFLNCANLLNACGACVRVRSSVVAFVQVGWTPSRRWEGALRPHAQEPHGGHDGISGEGVVVCFYFGGYHTLDNTLLDRLLVHTTGIAAAYRHLLVVSTDICSPCRYLYVDSTGAGVSRLNMFDISIGATISYRKSVNFAISFKECTNTCWIFQ